MTTTVRNVTVEGRPFSFRGREGDFEWMVKQPAYADTLFAISENFIDSVRDDAEEGGGTAILRLKTPTHCTPPRAVGYTAGWSVDAGGFGAMDALYVKRAIDLSLERFAIILDLYPQYTRVIYSCAPTNPAQIGAGIFKATLCPAVVEYISLGHLSHCKPTQVQVYTPRASALRNCSCCRWLCLQTGTHASCGRTCTYARNSRSGKRNRTARMPGTQGVHRRVAVVVFRCGSRTASVRLVRDVPSVLIFTQMK